MPESAKAVGAGAEGAGGSLMDVYAFALLCWLVSAVIWIANGVRFGWTWWKMLSVLVHSLLVGYYLSLVL